MNLSDALLYILEAFYWLFIKKKNTVGVTPLRAAVKFSKKSFLDLLEPKHFTSLFFALKIFKLFLKRKKMNNNFEIILFDLFKQYGVPQDLVLGLLPFSLSL